jgi:hypothetical protein
MTADKTVERWAVMLTPLFPANADLKRSTQNECWLIDADWPLDGRGTRSRRLRISVTNDAIENYLLANEHAQRRRDTLLSETIARFLDTFDSRHDREPWNQPTEEISIRTEFLNALP